MFDPCIAQQIKQKATFGWLFFFCTPPHGEQVRPDGQSFWCPPLEGFLMPRLKHAIVLLGCCLLMATGAARAHAPLQSIPSLDVPRYMGVWYELAKFPNRFQKK